MSSAGSLQQKRRASGREGTPQGDFEQLHEARPRGTVLTFEIDGTYLDDAVFDAARLRSRIEDVDVDLSQVEIVIEAGG